jgi:hypothetical protein
MPRVESPSARLAVSASGEKDNQKCVVETRRLQEPGALLGQRKVLLDRSTVPMQQQGVHA